MNSRKFCCFSVDVYCEIRPDLYIVDFFLSKLLFKLIVINFRVFKLCRRLKSAKPCKMFQKNVVPNVVVCPKRSKSRQGQKRSK